MRQKNDDARCFYLDALHKIWAVDEGTRKKKGIGFSPIVQPPIAGNPYVFQERIKSTKSGRLMFDIIWAVQTEHNILTLDALRDASPEAKKSLSDDWQLAYDWNMDHDLDAWHPVHDFPIIHSIVCKQLREILQNCVDHLPALYAGGYTAYGPTLPSEFRGMSLKRAPFYLRYTRTTSILLSAEFNALTAEERSTIFLYTTPEAQQYETQMALQMSMKRFRYFDEINSNKYDAHYVEFMENEHVEAFYLYNGAYVKGECARLSVYRMDEEDHINKKMWKYIVHNPKSNPGGLLPPDGVDIAQAPLYLRKEADPRWGKAETILDLVGPLGLYAAPSVDDAVVVPLL
jgi:hypothetical protein